MICWILLLLILTSCVSGTFVVTVTQSSYQAEENHTITLEWTFTPTTDTSSISIYCGLLADHDLPVLYHQHEGVEIPESQSEQFSGRVQCNKDVLREGRLRLNVSRLRTEDSGLYMCQVIASDEGGSDECRLKVAAAVDQPQPERPTERPEPQSRGRIGLYVGLGAALLVSCLAFIVCYCLFTYKKSPKVKKNTDEETKIQSVRETKNQVKLDSGGLPLYHEESSEH